MATIVFVHGIGGRQENYDHTFELIREKVEQESNNRKLTSPKVVPCVWGDTKGAKPQGVSRPYSEKTTEPEGTGQKDTDETFVNEVLLWEKLYNDPLWEIRQLGYRDKPSEYSFGESNQDKLRNKVEALGEEICQEGFTNNLVRFGLKDVMKESYEIVVNSNSYSLLLDTVGVSQQVECAVLARGLVAVSIQLLKNQGRSQSIIYNAKLRDQAIEFLNAQMMPDKEMSFGIDVIKEILTKPLKEGFKRGLEGVGLPILTDYLQKSQQMFNEKIDVLAGDILVYQTAHGGEGIRQKIQDTIQSYKDEENLIILAHSLGGVACIDLLIKKKIPSVKLLITVGSQAPFFYEIDALQSLQPKQEKSFPQDRFQWLNIYDPRDFLSFVGRNVFAGCVEDKKVNNKQPFPQSHLAYWENSETWEEIFNYLMKKKLV